MRESPFEVKANRRVSNELKQFGRREIESTVKLK
jgi:hypothetical protein